MFQIDHQDIPRLPTRAAFLILDVQNDVIDGYLKVNQPPDLLQKIAEMAPHFRSWGEIMWILSQFERHRPINDDGPSAETIITEKQLSKVGMRQRQNERMSALLHKVRSRHSDQNDAKPDFQNLDADDDDSEDEDEDEDEEVSEAFLTLSPGEEPKCCIPMTRGVNLHSSMLQNSHKGFNSKADVIFGKTHYSAFKSGALIQRLRSSMVTQLYICGALTNISVFCSVLDAVRHGYSITIITDCCGYKSKILHDEAIKQMTETFGCEVMTSSELLQSMRSKSSGRVGAPAREISEKEKGESSETSQIDDLMSKLDLHQDEAVPFRPEPETIKSHLWTILPPASGSTGSVTPPSDLVSPPTSRSQPSATNARVKAKVSARRRSSKSKKEPLENHNDMPDLEKLTIKDKASDKKGVSLETTGKRVGKAKEEPSPPVHTPTFCEGDSCIIDNLFPKPLADRFFKDLLHEIVWQRMSHQTGNVPRLVAVQGLVSSNGTHPIYRHPADESPPLHPFSKTVKEMIPYVERALGHTVNHVLIQFYRDGTDHITEHSDKTLDIVPGTFIANVSLGAERTMTFRTKKPINATDKADLEEGGVRLPPRDVSSSPKDSSGKKGDPTEPAPRATHKESLPHNSLCKFGLKSNAVWLHGIRPDKRPQSEKSAEVLAFNGSRISLTFRKIGTFLNRDETLIWGQGAIAKEEKNARKVVSGDSEATQNMLIAFGRENKMGSEFVWESEYGTGFDVLHIKNNRKLVLNEDDEIGGLRVKILLKELGLGFQICDESDLMHPIRLDANGKEIPKPNPNETKPIFFVDNDARRSRAEGDAAIFFYLDRIYGGISGPDFDMGKCYTRMLLATHKDLYDMEEELPIWESFILEHGDQGFVAGTDISLVDYFFWPVLHHLGGNNAKFRENYSSEVLKSYHDRIGERDGFKWVNEAISDSD